MKNLFLPIVLCLCSFSCSIENFDEEEINNMKNSQQEIISLKDSQTPESKMSESDKKLILGRCGGIGFAYNNEFDGDYMLNESILIRWDVTLCGSTNLPSKISIIFTEQNGLTIYRPIVSDISPNFQSDPSVGSTGNFLWFVDDYTLIDGGQYQMIMQNEDTGGTIDIGSFTITGINNPQNCNFNVSNELDGDYRIRFFVDNGSDCFTNVQYDIDYGDGQSHVIC